MRNIGLSAIILFVLLAIFACEKEIKITGTASPLVSLNDIRALYNGSPRVLKADDMLGASYVSGIVISDPVNGNSPEGIVVLQSFKRKLLRGIALGLGASAGDYHPGDSLVVKIEGKTLDRINGVLQISGVTKDDVIKVSVGNKQHINITSTTFTDVTRWFENYESTLVSFRSVVTPDLVFGDVFNGVVTLSDWVNTMKLVTLPTATFASNGVPGFGDFTGIFLKDAEAEAVLMLRSADDYESQSLEPYHPGELYMNFPEGWENPIGPRKGAYASGGNYETYPTGEWFMNQAYTLSSANVVNKTGTWSLMMRNGGHVSVLEMNFNLPYGASKLSFDYGAATTTDTNLPITLLVEYSTDSGLSWKQVGGDLVITTVGQKYLYSEEMDIVGAVRFRIYNSGAQARAFIDNIAIYQN